MKKSKKILSLILIILVLSILSFGYLFFTKYKTQYKKIYIASSNNKVENVVQNDKKKIANVEILKVNEWNNGNKKNAQYNINIENISGNTIENWKLDFEVNGDFKVSQIWNGNYNISNGNLTISCEEYNSQIQQNQKVEIGFIAEFEKDINIDTYKLSANNIENSSFKQIENSEKTKKNNLSKKVVYNRIQKNNLIKIMKLGAININQNSCKTPVELHGKLSVKGTDIVDYKGNLFQLRGVSTHSIYEYSEYINIDTFKELRDKWKINVIRIAMYSNPNDGYSSSLHEKVKEAVNYASELGLYVIIDWHILYDNNPNIYKEQAISFFKEMATEFKDNNNVIYEICNEPNGADVTWIKDVKPYAEEVIGKIRNIDKDSIIIVGTPTWSQDVDIVADNKIDNYSDIMYALHFYADTHKEQLRAKLTSAIEKNLPVFVSEFGISSADGNGNINKDEGDIWINLLNDYNISWVCWNLSNKNEASALLKNTCKKLYNFETEDLSQEGVWLLEKLKDS